MRPAALRPPQDRRRGLQSRQRATGAEIRKVRVLVLLRLALLQELLQRVASMHWRPTRLLTTVAVIGLCAFAAWRGVDIVRFVAASEGATADQHRVEALRPWVATPGLAVAALEASLATALDPTDIDGARRRGEQIGALLARRPLSSMHWL